MKEYYFDMCEHLEAITGIDAVELFRALCDWTADGRPWDFSIFARDVLSGAVTV